LKRLVSILLTIALLTSLYPLALGATVVDEAEIAAVIEKVPPEIRGEIAAIMEIYPSMSTVPNDKNWADEVNPLLKTHVSTNGVYQCFGFAMYVYARLFGIYAGGSALDFTRDECSVKLLQGAEIVDYESFADAGVKSGAHIRTTEDFEGLEEPNDYGHSMILLSYDEESICVYHGNADGKGTVRVDKYTWDEFNCYHLAGYRTPRRIKYIAVPQDTCYPEAPKEECAPDTPVEEEPENTFSDRDVGQITVYIDGVKQEYEVEPKIINGRTMVPFRGIFEALGAQVGWSDDTRVAYGKTDTRFVEIGIGNDFLLKNSERVDLDSPAVIDALSGRTLVPARAIAESLDCKVEWHGDTRVVEITSLESNDPDILVVGVYEGAPFCYSEDDELSGFDVDLAKYIAQKMKREPVFVKIGVKNALNLTGEGIADLHCGVAVDKELLETYDCSYVYRHGARGKSENVALCFAKGSPLVETANMALLTATRDGILEGLKRRYGI